jgi:hypothetical protein
LSIGTGVGLAIAGIGAVAGAGIGAAGSESAASTQASAAENAQALQAQEEQNSLNFQEQEWNTQQANEAPWLAAGKGGLANLQAILAQPGQGWDQTFQAPTAAQAEAQPGYQFQLGQGEQAIQNMYAAKGSAGGGNEGEALTNYAENAARSDYNNVYNQAFNTYQQNYGQYNNQLNRLASLAGLGQTSANTLGQEGQGAATNVGNISLTAGAQQGQDIQNAGAAEASGYAGLANAFGGGVNSISNLLALQQILSNQNNANLLSPGDVS